MYRVRKYHHLQTCTTFESTSTDGNHRLREDQHHQTGAGIESLIVDIRHGIGNSEILKTLTFRKSALSDTLQRGRKRHRQKVCTLLECFLTDTSHLKRNRTVLYFLRYRYIPG